VLSARIAVVADTIQNLGSLRCCAERVTSPSFSRGMAAWRALADADLMPFDGAISPGQFHRNPPPHLASGLLPLRTP